MCRLAARPASTLPTRCGTTSRVLKNDMPSRCCIRRRSGARLGTDHSAVGPSARWLAEEQPDPKSHQVSRAKFFEELVTYFNPDTAPFPEPPVDTATDV